MKRIVNVNTGEVKVSKKDVILKSAAIGSCVVIAAYDKKKKVGSLAHIMLPGKAPKSSEEKTRYAANAIDELIEKIERQLKQKHETENIFTIRWQIF